MGAAAELMVGAGLRATSIRGLLLGAAIGTVAVGEVEIDLVLGNFDPGGFAWLTYTVDFWASFSL
jgi:hypothetical protein